MELATIMKNLPRYIAAGVCVEISDWSAPAWLRADPGQKHQWLNEFDAGVMVLEEFDKANPEVKKAAAPVILYGGIANWFLKPGIGRIILSNHADDGRQGSTKDFDFVINRKVLLHATQSVGHWMDWADRNGIDPMFKAFAQKHPSVVFSGDLPKEQGPFMTARSFCMLESIVKGSLLDSDGRITDMEQFTEEASACCGGPAARDLVNFFRFREEVPSWDEIVNSPGRAKLPDSAGAQLMVSHICAYRVDEKTIDAAVAYIRRIRKEFHITFCKAATRRNFRLVNSKPFEKWTREQPELVALINALGGAR